MISDVAAAFKTAFADDAGVQVYDYVPDSQLIPCVIVYPENTEISVPVTTTWIVWCIAGRLDEQGAQQTLSDWLSDDGTIVNAIQSNSTLSAVVDSVVPLRIRNWRPGLIAEGRPAYWQAELVCEVIT
jgi:hypothetical protein